MSFLEQQARDISGIVNNDGPGNYDAVFAPVSGISKTGRVILHLQPTLSLMGPGQANPAVITATADMVYKEPMPHDLITIGSDAWEVLGGSVFDGARWEIPVFMKERVSPV